MKKVFLSIVFFLVTALLVYFLAPGWILRTSSRFTVAMGGFSKEQAIVGDHLISYYDNHRDGKPVLLLIHGFADRKESWFPFVNQLSKDYRILLPDALGHGENPRDTSITYSFADQADFMHSFSEKLEVESFHLVGISMGGGIATKYAIRFPNGLRSLTLISSAGFEGCAEASAMDKLMDNYATFDEKKDNFPLIPKTYTRANARLFKKYIFYGKFFAPNHLLKQYLMPAIIEREFFIEVLDDLIDITTGIYKDPLDDEIGQVQCPVLVIWGEDDPLIHASCADVIAENMKVKPEMVLLSQCGHATIVEQPKKTMMPLKSFLSDTEAEYLHSRPQ